MYKPGATPTSLSGAIVWVAEELQRIGDAFSKGTAREVEFLNVAPAKPREGMLYGADGTNWDPGSGQGVYSYYGGAWHKLG